MKSLLPIIAALFLSINTLNAQFVCRSQLLNYTGPHNTADLTTKLYSSNNAIISALSSALKQALVAHTVFDNGYPRGIDSSDTCIVALFQSSSAASILSAIFSCPVAMCSYSTKPVFPTMSVATFMALYSSNPTLYAFTPYISACYNCYFGKKDVCCYVGGSGCYDIAIEFTNTGDHVYVIQE